MFESQKRIYSLAAFEGNGNGNGNGDGAIKVPVISEMWHF